MLKIFPWQEGQWQQWQLTRKNDRLPHALILEGPEGIGIDKFSRCITYNLLCEQLIDDTTACGHCRACDLLRAGSHPDLRMIEPEEEGKQIKVDQIRSLIDFINLKSQYRRYKITIITPAESMNRSAANTLLKTLEEPPGKSLLILLSHRPNLLPITIRSRCQHIYFKPAYDKDTLNWLYDQMNDPSQAEQLLAMAGGAPLAALELLENNRLNDRNIILDDLEALMEKQDDPVKVAEKWNSMNANHVLRWLLQLIGDMVRLKSSAKPLKIQDADLVTRLQHLINPLDLRELILCHDLVLKNYSLGMGQVGYNSQGLLEDFIIYWQQSINKREGN
jgi:DNA polymerase-3 subunit delta'